jgi:hypothetical protein
MMYDVRTYMEEKPTVNVTSATPVAVDSAPSPYNSMTRAHKRAKHIHPDHDDNAGNGPQCDDQHSDDNVLIDADDATGSDQADNVADESDSDDDLAKTSKRAEDDTERVSVENILNFCPAH